MLSFDLNVYFDVHTILFPAFELQPALTSQRAKQTLDLSDVIHILVLIIIRLQPFFQWLTKARSPRSSIALRLWSSH